MPGTNARRLFGMKTRIACWHAEGIVKSADYAFGSNPPYALTCVERAHDARPRNGNTMGGRHGIENHAPRLHRDRRCHYCFFASRSRVDADVAIQADQNRLRLSCRRFWGLVYAHLRRISLPETRPAGYC